ncbi:metalloprotease [Anatilimnocola sp. NA78]|uniref:metalloprotease n=1 Tax=Anatilimnocola sp. NA78 TaxID=3415683 RepID=UPI003CE487B7
MRVHPLYWLFVVFAAGAQDPKIVIIWLLVSFVSILIHELGHALMMRRFGRQAHIVLYMMGGLAIEGSPNPYDSYYSPRGERRTPWEQIYISLAGPGAQLLLALLIYVFIRAMGGDVVIALPEDGILPYLKMFRSDRMSDELAILLNAALYFNTWWALVNLVPVYPLDGGQIAMQLFTIRDPHGGQVRALQLSIAAGVGMAVLFLTLGSWFTVMLFGSLAFSSYMAYMQIYGQGGGRYR